MVNFLILLSIGRRVSYANLAHIEIYYTFSNYYLYEAGFSSLMTITTKQQFCLVVKDNTQVDFLNTAPKISAIVRKKQLQKSH